MHISLEKYNKIYVYFKTRVPDQEPDLKDQLFLGLPDLDPFLFVWIGSGFYSLCLKYKQKRKTSIFAFWKPMQKGVKGKFFSFYVLSSTLLHLPLPISNVSEDDEIEPRTVATLALTV